MNLKLKQLLGACVLSQLFASVALAAPTCVFVIGQVDGVQVAIPGVFIPHPGSQVPIPTLRIHVESQSLQVLDYVLVTPEVDVTTPVIAWPDVVIQTPGVFVSVPPTPLNESVCVNQGVEVGAFPIYAPPIDLTTPEVATHIPLLEFNALGQSYSVGGQLIIVEGRRIVIPTTPALFPGVRVETPPQSIVIEYNGLQEVFRVLAPPG